MRQTSEPSSTPQVNLNITDFKSCKDAGYPVQESYPAVCRGPDGQSFTEFNIVPYTEGLVTLEKGVTGGGFDQPRQEVITSSAEFEKFWVEWMRATSQKVPMSDIDFSRQVVFVVFAGKRTSGGHDIVIKDVIEKNNGFEVILGETTPSNCGSTGAITYPYHIASYQVVPPDIDPVLFDKLFPSQSNTSFTVETAPIDC